MKILLSLLLCVIPTFAQSHVEGTHASEHVNKIGHYIRTHKRLLIADAIIVASWSADAASSVHDQRSGCCVEENPVLGKHPSTLASWSYAMGVASLMVTGEHLIWWAGNKYGDSEAGHVLIWPAPVGFAIGEYFNVKYNAWAADYNKSVARARVMQR